VDAILEGREAGNLENDLVADQNLAARVARGDEEAFEELVRRHHPRLSRIAGRFFRRPEIVEELVQEALVKAYTSMASYRGEMPLQHWLSKIAVNACYDQLRRQKARPEATVDTLVFQLASSPSLVEAEDARICAEQILSRLAPEERLVLTLMVLEDLPVKDVARLTGWSVPNVKIRAFRARAKLRKIVGRG